MKDVELNTFPSNRIDALVILYLENQDLSDLSPHEIAKKYLEVNKELRLAFRSSKRDKDGYPSIK